MRRHLIPILPFFVMLATSAHGDSSYPGTGVDGTEIIFQFTRDVVGAVDNDATFNATASSGSGCMFLDYYSGSASNCNTSSTFRYWPQTYVTRVGLSQVGFGGSGGCDIRLATDDGATEVWTGSWPPVHGTAMTDDTTVWIEAGFIHEGEANLMVKAGSNNGNGSGTPVCTAPIEWTILFEGIRMQ